MALLSYLLPSTIFRHAVRTFGSGSMAQAGAIADGRLTLPWPCDCANVTRRRSSGETKRRMRNTIACKRGRSFSQRETGLRKIRATRRGREPGFSVIHDHVPVTNHLAARFAPRMGLVVRHDVDW